MRNIFLAIALLICINAEAQVIRAEPFYVAPEEAAAPSGDLLLDSFPGAAVAYSLRKLDKDYTGSAIRVRRSSDNSEQDIGFVNNYLDTAAMKTFVGANNGFVVTWYNQADSAGVFGVRNATQSTAAIQPMIISAGVVLYKNGEVDIRYTADYLRIANSSATFNSFHNGNNAAFVIVADTDGGGFYGVIGNTDSGGDGFRLMCATTYNMQIISNTAADNINNTLGINTFPQLQSIIFANFDADNATASDRSEIYINAGSANKNNTLTANPTAVNSSYNLDIGSRGNASAAFLGSIQEVILWTNNQSSNRTAIESNINSFYSIY